MQKQPRTQKLNLFLKLGLIISASFLIQCQSRNTDTNPVGDIQVRIPFYSDGQYTMSNVTLVSVTDTVHLSGGAAHFLISASENGKIIQGIEPMVRSIRNSHGVYVATDSLSLQLMSLYAHFEKLYFLDQAMGVPFYVQLTWPRLVAVNTKMSYEDGRPALDNALYKSKFDAYFFTRFTADTLPLTVNAGVIAHEHFHAIFHQLVIKKNPELFDLGSAIHPHAVMATSEPSQKLWTHTDSNRFLARGLNEGLADVWGWIYSGDDKFVSRTGAIFKNRDLDQQPTPIRSQPQADIYNYGSAYAKVLVGYARSELKNSAGDLNAAKIKLGQALLKTLPQWSEYLRKSENAERIVEDNSFLDLLNKNLQGISVWYVQALNKKQ